jgi:hypothetical protein
MEPIFQPLNSVSAVSIDNGCRSYLSPGYIAALVSVLLGDPKQLQDVRQIALNFIASSIATNDNIFSHSSIHRQFKVRHIDERTPNTSPSQLRLRSALARNRISSIESHAVSALHPQSHECRITFHLTSAPLLS